MTRPIDLRSDTVTRPTEAMRAAMARAEVGDDVFGDDPTVLALQAQVAALLGFEAALFMPSGTQSNLCALLSHCERGDEYLVGQWAHTYRWEGGGAAVLGSIQPQPLPQDATGALSWADIEANIKPLDPHFARTRLLCLENTWSGQTQSLALQQEQVGRARALGLSTHLDGARLFNAAVALQVPPAAVASGFDSVSVCFSKGLGAPVGSALCGTAAFIEKAKRWRKVAGGGWRQAGLLAAAAQHAVNHHVERLAIDHQHARQLAQGLSELPGVRVQDTDTNMVFLHLDATLRQRFPQGVAAALAAQGLACTGTHTLRLVTHLDVSADDVHRAIVILRAVLNP